MDLNRIYTWDIPTRLIFGPGCSRKAGEELKRLGGRKALLVTDRGIRGAGVLAGILEGLEAAGVACAIYDGVEPNPPLHCVEQAAALFRQEGCDCLLAVGGGSSMDTTKAVGAVLAHPGLGLREMEGRGKILNPIVPLVAVPTTCGTGSEVASGAVLTDLETHYKFGIGGLVLVPKVALLDGALLVGMPGPVIAATGLDALSHAVGSYVSLNRTPFSDAVDLRAISLISEWLRPAVANANLEALSHMILASTLAGMAMANNMVDMTHSMSSPITAHFGVTHGVANAILQPYVMDFNLIGNPRAYADIARAMGEDTYGLTVMEAARLSVKAFRELSQDVGMPENFKSLGVTAEYMESMIDDTFKSRIMAGNPVRATREDVRALYLKAIG